MQRLRGTLMVLVGWGVFALMAGALGYVPEANAFDLASLRERFDDRRSELENRLSGYDDSQSESVNDGEQGTQPEQTSLPPSEQEDTVQNVCGCSARLEFSDPEIRWHNGTLQFVPRFDLKIRVRQEDNAPPWSLALHYAGLANDTSFSGQKTFGGQCFDGRYEYTGLAGAPITMSDIVRSIFGSDDEQEILVRMNATLSGCDIDEESEQAEIEIEEFGNLDIGRWRRAR